MRAIDRVRARHEALKRRHVTDLIEFPDENGKPLAVYADPWTVADDENFDKRFGRGRDWTYMVICEKALDANGERLFNRDDAVTLKAMLERHVAVRLAAQIQFTESVEAQGNE